MRRHVMAVVVAAMVLGMAVVSDSAFASEPSSFLTLDRLPALSNDSRPQLSGTTSTAGTVTVRVYEGASLANPEFESIQAVASEPGSWTTADLAPPLEEGTYTIRAEEAVGSGVVFSEPIEYTVDSEVPRLTLQELPSHVTEAEPTFSGIVVEPGEVTVDVFAGTDALGEPVAKGSILVTSGSGEWRAKVSALPIGMRTYTAVATEGPTLRWRWPVRSNLVAFTAYTEPSPVLSLDRLPTPSDNSRPALAGKASAAGTVTVRVYEGSSVANPEVESVQVVASEPGPWTANHLPVPLEEEGTYTIRAEEMVGSGVVFSEPIEYTVDFALPRLTLLELASPVTEAEPTFSGNVVEPGEVTVEVFAGPVALGEPVAKGSVLVTRRSGEWSAKVSALPVGTHTYTAIATEGPTLKWRWQVSSLPVVFPAVIGPTPQKGSGASNEPPRRSAPEHQSLKTLAQAGGAPEHERFEPLTSDCVVPSLKGDSLKRASSALHRAHCQVGRLIRPKAHGVDLVVIAQKVKPSTKLATNAVVGLTLGRPRHRAA